MLSKRRMHIFRNYHQSRYDIFVFFLQFITAHCCPSFNRPFSASQVSENFIIEKLLKNKSSIARYRIVFLPECNICDPIKRLFTDQEWTKMELDWEKVVYILFIS